MCRLFGFRSVMLSQVHRSLLSAENSLVVQSERHRDGWGVAYYVEGYPHVIKSADTAVSDALFRRVSGIVTSETVVAHLRKATVGALSLVNSHPFQYGSWVFAHNGNIPGFDGHRESLVARIAPIFRRFVLGDTDSEVIFYLVLSHLARRVDIHRKGTPMADIVAAVEDMIEDVRHATGLDCYGPAGPGCATVAQTGLCEPLYLSFILTNGHVMLAHQGGKELFFSTYKERCPDREVCASFAPMCESESRTGYVNHLIVSSEPLHGENVWLEMRPGQLVGVDWRMHIYHGQARGAC